MKTSLKTLPLQWWSRSWKIFGGESKGARATD